MTKTKPERSEFRLPTLKDICEKMRFAAGDFKDDKSKQCARLCLCAAYHSNRSPESNLFFENYAWYCKDNKIPEATAREVLEHLMEQDFVEHNGKIVWPFLNGVAQ